MNPAPFVLDRPDVVHSAVCDVLQSMFPTVSEGMLFSDGKGNQAIAWLRQVGMYVMATRLNVNHTMTARQFNRDRTTIIHAVQLVGRECTANAVTLAFVDFVEGQTVALLQQLEAAETPSSMPFPMEQAHG